MEKLEKVLIWKRILLKKKAIIHGKDKLSKIKGSICDIPIETTNIRNILSRPAVSNRLVVVE